MNTTPTAADFPKLSESQNLVLGALHRGDQVGSWVTAPLLGRLRNLGLLTGTGREITLTETGAAVALVAAEHILTLSRRQLGRGALAGSGMTYGSNGRCSCGSWTSFSNERGRTGQRYVTNDHHRHQASHYAAALATVREQRAAAAQ